MKNCRECLHHHICDLWRRCEGQDASCMEISGCTYFKDRSRFVELPCKVGDTVYGQFRLGSKEILECKVTRIKACQFRNGSLHYFLDVEFDIIDPYYNDGRLMRCGQQAVFGEVYGSWHRAYRTREEAEKELANMDGDGNG